QQRAGGDAEGGHGRAEPDIPGGPDGGWNDTRAGVLQWDQLGGPLTNELRRLSVRQSHFIDLAPRSCGCRTRPREFLSSATFRGRGGSCLALALAGVLQQESLLGLTGAEQVPHVGGQSGVAEKESRGSQPVLRRSE